MNVNKIMNASIKEIEAFLNENNSQLEEKISHSTEAYEIREKMFLDLKKRIGIKNFYSGGGYGKSIVEISDHLKIIIKISAIKTDKIVKVSKLKSKYLNRVGSFKVSGLEIKFDGLVYEVAYLDNFKIKIVDGWSSTNQLPSLTLNGSGTLNEICSKDNLIIELNKEGQKIIDFKSRFSEIKPLPYRGVLYEIKKDVSQPILKKYMGLFYGGRRVIKTDVSDKLPPFVLERMSDVMSGVDFYELLIEIVAEKNKDLINKVINETFKIR